jgi:hypothetical protein
MKEREEERKEKQGVRLQSAYAQRTKKFVREDHVLIMKS